MKLAYKVLEHQNTNPKGNLIFPSFTSLNDLKPFQQSQKT